MNANVSGVTLLSLIIIVIILLILGGITMSALTGPEGIIKRVSDAATATQIAKAREQIELEINNIQAMKSGNATLQDLIDRRSNKFKWNKNRKWYVVFNRGWYIW